MLFLALCLLFILEVVLLMCTCLYVRMYVVPVCKAQPEDIVGIKTQWLHRAQHQHVANVKLNHSQLLPVEKHWIFQVLTHNLENKETKTQS